ncbi:MAG: TonB-dependent receptor, partial [Alphaproteobacteria bacterium]
MDKSTARLIALALGLCVTPAWAQDAVDTAAPTPAAPEKSSGPRLDEIVVTAQKRAENIRDVPISVSAVDSEAMKNANVEDMNDLSKMTPNVRIVVRPTTTFLNIRGLGTGENAGFEQSVGLVVDGVYYGKAAYINDAFIDLARIEVLRGPQGTLFGKNTIAGAMNITTGTPAHEWQAELDMMMGELNHTRIRAVANAPLWEDVIAARAAFAREKRDGYMFNTTRNLNETKLDKANGRLKALFEIGDLDLTATYARSLTKQNGNGYQLTVAGDDVLTAYRLFDPEVEGNIDFVGSRNHPSQSRQISDTLSASANYDIADHTLTLIGGWSQYDFEMEVDADFGPSPFLILVSDSAYEQGSAELRVTSPPGPLEYVGGLYYFTSSLQADGGVDVFKTDDPVADITSLIAPDALSALLAPIFGAGPLPSFTAETQRLDFDQTQSSYAAFGQATWYVTDTIALVGGLRVSYEEKSVDMVHIVESSSGLPPLIFPFVNNAESYTAHLTREEWDVSPKASVKYDIDDDTMAYATYARGFKGGGFNAASYVPSDLEFEAEVADTYEAGVKTRLLDGGMTLNVGLFYTNFDNLQVAIFNGTQFIVGNAAKATTYGVEWDMAWLPLEELMLTFNGGYTNATYDSFPDAPCTAESGETACDLTGKVLARAPKWNGNIGAQWAVPIGNLPFGLFLATDLFYQGDTFLTTDLDPRDFQDAYIQWNAGLGLKELDGLWQFTVFGRNLT